MKLLHTTIAVLLFAAVTACGQTKKENSAGTEEVKVAAEAGTIHLTTQEFKEKIFNYETSETFSYLGDKPAIVDFYATWCGPCKALAPVLEELAKEYAGKIWIYKVDVDKNPELSSVFAIRSVPTLLFIGSDGEPSMSPGAPTKAQLKSIIEELLKEKKQDSE